MIKIIQKKFDFIQKIKTILNFLEFLKKEKFLIEFNQIL